MSEIPAYSANDFRDALKRLMPGYSWVVHKTPKGCTYLDATGTRSSGFNRLSTLYVIRRERDGKVTFEAKSSGYGTRAQWLHTHTDGTLARALRGLQDHYEYVSRTYLSHAKSLEIGRRLDACAHPSLPTPDMGKVA